MTPTRSRIAFGGTLLVLFGLAFGGAYVVRARQLDTKTVALDTVVAESTSAAETTVPLAVDSTLPAETTAIPETTAAPETTEAPTTTAAPVADLNLTTDGSAFGRGSGKAVWDDTIGCDSIATRAGVASDCDRLTIGGVGVAWVIDALGGATVLANDPGVDDANAWSVELDTAATPTKRPLVVDVTGDGEAEMLFGFRSSTNLAVDVIEVRDGTPGVALHLDLPGGRITAGDGVLDVWQAAAGGGFDHWTISRTDGRWTKDGYERTDSAPTGSL